MSHLPTVRCWCEEIMGKHVPHANHIPDNNVFTNLVNFTISKFRKQSTFSALLI